MESLTLRSSTSTFKGIISLVDQVPVFDSVFRWTFIAQGHIPVA
uniref:Uncharacterized protein n=1 Tax=Utricularia reniformis TaxID=192314 RepID=A0A1Y0B4F7_9LAMI|nr:hypothetical protein AEK19_MT2188 [Utricularia reniformis]ART32335.1 hypothetical protein AEK19_MT2188 [Utricularia reniformis]